MTFSGCGGFVLNDKNEILVVMEKSGPAAKCTHSAPPPHSFSLNTALPMTLTSLMHFAFVQCGGKCPVVQPIRERSCTRRRSARYLKRQEFELRLYRCSASGHSTTFSLASTAWLLPVEHASKFSLRVWGVCTNFCLKVGHVFLVSSQAADDGDKEVREGDRRRQVDAPRGILQLALLPGPVRFPFLISAFKSLLTAFRWKGFQTVMQADSAGKYAPWSFSPLANIIRRGNSFIYHSPTAKF